MPIQQGDEFKMETTIDNDKQQDFQEEGDNSLWNKFFPAALLVLYVALFSLHAIFTKQASYGLGDASPAALVLASEFLKCVLASLMFAAEVRTKGEAITLGQFKASFVKTDWLLSIPALIYVVYNNLAYYNLQSTDVSVYQVLMNSRVVMTGLLSVVLLKRRLSKTKWLSLVAISIGCSIASWKPPSDPSQKLSMGQLEWSVFTVCLQAFMSSLATVYFEKVIKTKSGGIESVHWQNFILYGFSVLMNGIIATFSSKPLTLGHLTVPMIGAILLSSLGGLVTSAVIKYHTSLTKTVASGAELIIVAILSSALFGTHLTYQLVTGALIVTAGMVVYNATN